LFAAIFNADGRPVDCQRFASEARSVENPGGAGHVAFIRSKPEPDPADGEWRGMESLGDRYWIVGRIRLDVRQALRALLAVGGGPERLSDALLCLHGYAAWGESFVDRLAGDFCFALWDRERQCLISARDQLGVRSLFHADAGHSRFVSDSLHWIVSAAPVSREIDDHWIGDFLGIGHSLDVERTVYRQIRRLAPAHVLKFSNAGAAARRYWRLEIGDPLHYRDRRQYAEQFLELLSLAIADRLPAGRVGISMSGGLDSTTLAACAVRVMGDPARVVAECTHFERLMPDQEKHFATLAARHLGIELNLRPYDDLTYDPEWRTWPMRSAEPSIGVVCARPDRMMALEQAGRARVWFFGEGPDNALMFEQRAYFSWLLERRNWLRMGEAALLYLKAKGFDGWGQTLRRHVGRRGAADESIDESIDVPPWIDRALVERVGLRERIRSGHGRAGDEAPEPRHPWHPRAVASFHDPIWPALFDGFDGDEALAPMVWRHPYLDLRVLDFMLSVPPVPWARRKLLLREAMQGRLPDAVLERNKAPLAESPFDQPIRLHGLPDLAGDDRLSPYVDVRRLPEAPPVGPALERLIAVHVLDHWLGQRVHSVGIAAGPSPL
jgi:asparagine synthase (glutamine-hydrolysing)